MSIAAKKHTSSMENTGLNLLQMTKEEVSEKIETILLERIRKGDKLAIFQLAQLYFEEVHTIFLKHFIKTS